MLHGFCPITPHQTGPAQDMHFGLHACVYTSQGSDSHIQNDGQCHKSIWPV